MKRILAAFTLVLACALLAPRLEACRFCRSGPDMDRYGVSDPMNGFSPDAVIEQFREEAPAPVPKPGELVTTRAALAEAAASATPQPGAPAAPVAANSYRARLLQVSATAPAAPLPVAPPRVLESRTVAPLSDWTARALDASLLAGIVGLGYFFRRGPRRASSV